MTPRATSVVINAGVRASLPVLQGRGRRGLLRMTARLCLAVWGISVAWVGWATAQDSAVPRTLTATASSFQPDQGNEPSSAADGKENTFAHTAWNPYQPP